VLCEFIFLIGHIIRGSAGVIETYLRQCKQALAGIRQAEFSQLYGHVQPREFGLFVSLGNSTTPAKQFEVGKQNPAAGPPQNSSSLPRIPGWMSLSRELARRQVAERGMGSVVVVAAPFFEPINGISHQPQDQSGVNLKYNSICLSILIFDCYLYH
jgi:hypothetical protein